jgi:hypothetical protein
MSARSTGMNSSTKEKAQQCKRAARFLKVRCGKSEEKAEREKED